MKKAATLLFLFLTILIPNLFASETTRADVWEAANSEVYGTKTGGMLGRGLLNAVTCFVDVLVHTVEGTKEGPPLVGTLTGLGSGIGCTALRAVSGVLDVVTFWVPGFNGFPVSRSYSDCLDFEEGELGPAEEVAPAPGLQAEDYAKPAAKAEDYAKPAAPAKHDTLDYVKK